MCRLILAALPAAFVVCASAVWSAAPQADKKAAAKDLKPLQGVWAQVSVTSNGQQEFFAKGKEPVLTISGDQYTVNVNGTVAESGVLKLGPPARAIDLVDSKGRSYPGIYEVSGDKLRMCLARDVVARPTEFSAKPGSGLLVAVYRRVETKK
jgi:uncharacterized protein (TIGR03067 family)